MKPIKASVTVRRDAGGKLHANEPKLGILAQSACLPQHHQLMIMSFLYLIRRHKLLDDDRISPVARILSYRLQRSSHGENLSCSRTVAVHLTLPTHGVLLFRGFLLRGGIALSHLQLCAKELLAAGLEHARIQVSTRETSAREEGNVPGSRRPR